MATVVGIQAGSIQKQLNFTRLHEQEADRIGLSILQKSGYDTRAMPVFFERLQKATRLLEGNTPAYLRTHPVTNERVADIANRVQQTPYHPVPSSFNYHLVRAKLQTMQKSHADAIAYFSAALGEHKHGNPDAQRYGLVLSLLRNNQLARATQEFAPLRAQITSNPMIATLAGQLLRANPQNQEQASLAFYRSATQNFPQHRALVYDYVEILLQYKRYSEAVALLNQQVTTTPSDPHLYEMQARTYAALGRNQEEHHALAYVYILHGNLRGSIEQLELAKQAGNNFQELSTIETELKQFREIAAAQEKKH